MSIVYQGSPSKYCSSDHIHLVYRSCHCLKHVWKFSFVPSSVLVMKVSFTGSSVTLFWNVPINPRLITSYNCGQEWEINHASIKQLGRNENSSFVLFNSQDARDKLRTDGPHLQFVCKLSLHRSKWKVCVLCDFSNC